MDPVNEHPPPSLSLSAQEWIDDVCLLFEQSWKAGRTPRLEEFLEDVPAGQREVLLRELLRLELHYRTLKGENPTAAEYQRRLPGMEEIMLSLFPSAPTPTVVGEAATGPYFPPGQETGYDKPLPPISTVPRNKEAAGIGPQFQTEQPRTGPDRVGGRELPAAERQLGRPAAGCEGIANLPERLRLAEKKQATDPRRRMAARGVLIVNVLVLLTVGVLGWLWSHEGRTARDKRVRQEVENAHGLLGDQFALVQTLPLERFAALADDLRALRYRPTRFRPYKSPFGVLVAVLWSRDGLEWQLSRGHSAAEAHEENIRQQEQGFHPTDVAAYIDGGKERFATLWVKTDGKQPARIMIAGKVDEAHGRDWKALADAGLYPTTYQVLLTPEENWLHSYIWVQSRVPPWGFWYGMDEAAYVGHLKGQLVPTDVSLTAFRGQPRFSAAFQASPTHEYTELHGHTPFEHLVQCRRLAAQGYRPVALAVTELPGLPLITASSWKRPVVPGQ